MNGGSQPRVISKLFWLATRRGLGQTALLPKKKPGRMRPGLKICENYFAGTALVAVATDVGTGVAVADAAALAALALSSLS